MAYGCQHRLLVLRASQPIRIRSAQKETGADGGNQVWMCVGVGKQKRVLVRVREAEGWFQLCCSRIGAAPARRSVGLCSHAAATLAASCRGGQAQQVLLMSAAPSRTRCTSMRRQRRHSGVLTQGGCTHGLCQRRGGDAAAKVGCEGVGWQVGL